MCSKTHSAERGRRHRLARLDALGRDRDDLARLDVAQELRADDVERAGLARHAVGVAEHAERERPQAHRVAERDDAPLGHDDRAVGALDAADDVHQRVLDGLRLVRGDERGDDLGIRGRAEGDALVAQLLMQLDDVDEVAVVRERDLALVGAVDRLRVLPRVRARGAVADVADRRVALQRAQLLLVEDLVDQALVAHGHDVAVLRRRDAGRLLAAVLERVEREVGEPGDLATRRDYAEDAALIARAIAVVEKGFSREHGDRRAVVAVSTTGPMQASKALGGE